ncbi:unnamed protein product [Leptidea sinapis]|uniref:Chitin-binding type-2 domain-containing protein n=1 Tax=Leptidea sinapis TaxID=189913 RepID=A0A5E4PU50_9NEOP|nr:unnamed protein product [Leptidea sinapis]
MKDPSRHECGGPRREIIESGDKSCERDGFFVQPGTECKRYYFCVTGIRTFLNCPTEQVFNGQVGVSFLGTPISQTPRAPSSPQDINRWQPPTYHRPVTLLLKCKYTCYPEE